MNRRNLLAGILAAGIAPAFARSGVLMPVRQIIVPESIVTGGGYMRTWLPTGQLVPSAMTLEMMRRVLKQVRGISAEPQYLVAHPSWYSILKGPAC